MLDSPPPLTGPHPRCWVCGQHHPTGLGLAFDRQPDGSVTATFDCDPRWEGYPGRVHGGVLAALLDGAMTHCLFAHDIQAYTAELNARYRAGVQTGRPVTVRAWRTDGASRLYRVQAELIQAGQVRATATAKFLSVPGPSSSTRAPHSHPGSNP